MRDFDEIKRRVKDKALGQLETICHKLFPDGKKDGRNFVIGDISGAAGKSLKVTLSGSDKGLWYDHATKEGGDIFSLWAMHKGLNFIQAFDEIANFVGESRVRGFSAKEKPKPYDHKKLKSMRGTPVLDYMKGRGINEDTLQLYKVRSHGKGEIRPTFQNRKGETDWFAHNEHFWIEQYIDPYGDRVLLKSTGINKTKDGKHDIWSPSQPYYTLWGWWLVKPSDRECVITEGGLDSMSVRQMLDRKIPVLSLPNGARNLTWIENDLDAMNQFDKIYLMLDQDKPDQRGIQPGEEGAKKIAERLGRARCYRVRIPEDYKDPNELLLNGQEGEKNFDNYLDAAETYVPPTIRSASALKNVTIENRKSRLAAIDSEGFVFNVPFIQMDGEITLIQGMSGSGKSDISYQMAVDDIRRGHKVLICSFEIPAEEMLEIMATQYFRKSPNDMEIGRFVDYIHGKLWFMEDHEDNINAKGVMSDLEYSVRRFGTDRIYIDSLHFVTGKDDYQAQDDFVKGLKNFSTKFRNPHISLVAHSRYIEGGEHRIQRIDDIEGSKGMLKPAQNIIGIWRNTPKEDAKDSPESVVNVKGEYDSDKYDRLMDQPDAYLICYKQRNGHRRRFKRGLWYDFHSRRFRLDKDAKEQPMTVPEKFQFDNKSDVEETDSQVDVDSDKGLTEPDTTSTQEEPECPF